MAEQPETGPTPDEAESAAAQGGGDESVEEYVRDIESDPAHNPDDPELERVRGG